jgi:hypothetical protein
MDYFKLLKEELVPGVLDQYLKLLAERKVEDARRNIVPTPAGMSEAKMQIGVVDRVEPRLERIGMVYGTMPFHFRTLAWQDYPQFATADVGDGILFSYIPNTFGIRIVNAVLATDVALPQALLVSGEGRVWTNGAGSVLHLANGITARLSGRAMHSAGVASGHAVRAQVIRSYDANANTYEWKVTELKSIGTS